MLDHSSCRKNNFGFGWPLSTLTARSYLIYGTLNETLINTQLNRPFAMWQPNEAVFFNDHDYNASNRHFLHLVLRNPDFMSACHPLSLTAT